LIPEVGGRKVWYPYEERIENFNQTVSKANHSMFKYKKQNIKLYLWSWYTNTAKYVNSGYLWWNEGNAEKRRTV
jgi:hypothetical protein